MLCTVKAIIDNYAFLLFDDNGITMQVSLDFLPPDLYVGERLKLKNSEYYRTYTPPTHQ